LEWRDIVVDSHLGRCHQYLAQVHKWTSLSISI
jgi:hypothetical protein